MRPLTSCLLPARVVLVTALALSSCTASDEGKGSGGDGGTAPSTGGANGAGGAASVLGAGGSSGGAVSPPGTGAAGASGSTGGGAAGGSLTSAGGSRSPGSDGGDAAIPPSGSEGDVRIVKRMGDPSFDAVVTRPSLETITWLDEHFHRMEVFTTFFDDKVSFYPKGWVYSDSAAIYVGSGTATEHADWILEDPAGDAVYLDWGCSGGTCPQYAADVGNAAFRAWWIDNLRATLQKGYLGAWIDDVNLALRFSNGSSTVSARSPTTGQEMTEEAWSAAVAAFMTEVRASLPGYELLHNSIWYARPARQADAHVQTQIRAADVINLEGGFASDGGLTGGTGEWSIHAKMRFIDAVHDAGRWVVIDDFPSNDIEREYALGCYFLVTDGRDALGDFAMAKDTWWSGYDVHLGRALSPRTRESDGVFRREFERGLVLVLEPGAGEVTVILPRSYRTLDGAEVTSVTLGARNGAVLVTP